MSYAMNNSTLKNLLVFDSHGEGTKNSFFSYLQFDFTNPLIFLALKNLFAKRFSVPLGVKH